MCGISVKPILADSGKSLIQYRGPNSTDYMVIDGIKFLFHRLAIMDTSSNGNQPFENDSWIVVCNGEIFNYKQLKHKYIYTYHSHSDCEVLLPMIAVDSMYDLCNELDGEFAFVAYNKTTQQIFAARDPIGIRPLFYGYTADKQIAFASEMKELLDCCAKIYPFPPGHYFDGEFKPYLELANCDSSIHTNPDEISQRIHDILINSVIKRLDSDVPFGFLLSGGLDSSLVCAIAARHLQVPITTFAIGLDKNPIDLKYAQQMADYIGSNHHEVIFTDVDIANVVEQVIWTTETWDITTIRASIPMYLLCKYIKEQTDIRVLLTGEVSDELFGYKYTDFAPNATEFQRESQKRIRELYMYDVLRADRCISSNSLEARVPFADKEFVEYVMNIDPQLKLNTYNMGKYLLRNAFVHDKLLPDAVLWRDKAAFSDAVGHGMVDYLIQIAESKYSDADLTNNSYTYNKPQTKEALMYRNIFHRLFPNQEHVITGYWLPNHSWPNCQLSDPSARHLPNYGASAT